MAKTTKTPGTGTADGSNADELMAAAGMNPASQDVQDGGGSVTNNATGEEPTADPDPQGQAEMNPANIEAPAHEETLQQAATPVPLPTMLPQDQRPPMTRQLPAIQEPTADPDLEEDEDVEEDDSPMYPGDPIDAKASELHAARLKKYGPDYVVTVRPGTNQRQIWSRSSWKMIRGDKGGWKEVSPIPAEVRNLNK